MIVGDVFELGLGERSGWFYVGSGCSSALDPDSIVESPKKAVARDCYLERRTLQPDQSSTWELEVESSREPQFSPVPVVLDPYCAPRTRLELFEVGPSLLAGKWTVRVQLTNCYQLEPRSVWGKVRVWVFDPPESEEA